MITPGTPYEVRDGINQTFEVATRAREEALRRFTALKSIEQAEERLELDRDQQAMTAQNTAAMATYYAKLGARIDHDLEVGRAEFDESQTPEARAARATAQKAGVSTAVSAAEEARASALTAVKRAELGVRSSELGLEQQQEVVRGLAEESRDRAAGKQAYGRFSAAVESGGLEFESDEDVETMRRNIARISVGVAPEARALMLSEFQGAKERYEERKRVRAFQQEVELFSAELGSGKLTDQFGDPMSTEEIDASTNAAAALGDFVSAGTVSPESAANAIMGMRRELQSKAELGMQRAAGAEGIRGMAQKLQATFVDGLPSAQQARALGALNSLADGVARGADIERTYERAVLLANGVPERATIETIEGLRVRDEQNVSLGGLMSKAKPSQRYWIKLNHQKMYGEDPALQMLGKAVEQTIKAASERASRGGLSDPAMAMQEQSRISQLVGAWNDRAEELTDVIMSQYGWVADDEYTRSKSAGQGKDGTLFTIEDIPGAPR